MSWTAPAALRRTTAPVPVRPTRASHTASGVAPQTPAAFRASAAIQYAPSAGRLVTASREREAMTVEDPGA